MAYSRNLLPPRQLIKWENRRKKLQNKPADITTFCILYP
jgi:hypothetical protein